VKPYSEYFDWFGTLLFGIYGLFFIVLIWIFSGVMLKNRQDQLTSCLAFIFLGLFIWVAAFTSLTPYYPDTNLFAEIVENGVHDSQSKGVILYYLIGLPFMFLSAYQLEVYLLFQQFIFILAMIFLWKSWLIHCIHQKIKSGLYEIFIILAVLYPSTLLFITIPLREFFQIFGFSIFLYGLALYINKGQISWMIIGAVITIFVRPQMIIFYPFLILVAKQKNVLKLLMYSVIIFPLTLLLFQLVGFKFRVSWFAYLRNAGVENFGSSGMTYGAVEWKTYLDILLDLPQLALQFLLSPLPILHSVNPFSMFTLVLDLVFVIFVLFGVLSIKLRVSLMYIKMFVFSITLFSMWEFYIGGAVRHRFPLILMVLPLATLYYSTLLESLCKNSKVIKE
jgi:hypothetical protein